MGAPHVRFQCHALSRHKPIYTIAPHQGSGIVEVARSMHERDLIRAGPGFLFLKRTLYYADGGWFIEKIEEAFFSQRRYGSLEPRSSLPGGRRMNLKQKR